MYLIRSIFVTLLASAVSGRNILPQRDLLTNSKELLNHNNGLEQDNELVEFWNRDLASSITSQLKLEVQNGDGTGKYKGGSKVNINADLCPSGKIFSKWIIIWGSPKIQNRNNPDTILTMPDDYVMVKAICKDHLEKKK